MTIEEKAKAYDNVRDKIAIRFGSNVAKEIFSEYEESEDEKVKKALIQNLKERFGTNGTMGGILDMPRVLAWFEKQGEKGTKGNDREIPFDAWSEEDEERLSDAIFFVREYQIPTRDKRLLNAAKKTEDWLRTFKDRVQSKQEWSEEDESRIDNLCHFLEEYGNQYYGHLTLQGTISWLKSLRPHEQWKPSEEMLEALYRATPENVMEKSEDEMLLDKLYQGLKYGRVLSNKQ